MNIKKLIQSLLLGLIFVILAMLWMRWEAEFSPPQAISTGSDTQGAGAANTPQNTSTVPQLISSTQNNTPSSTLTASSSTAAQNEANPPVFAAIPHIHIKTNVLTAEIDLQGGNIVSSQLLHYKTSLKNKKPFTLFSRNPNTLYQAQSGLTGIPDSNQILYHVVPSSQPLVLILKGESQGLSIEKIYRFEPNSYHIQVQMQVQNQGQAAWTGAFFGQLLRTPTKTTSSGFLGSYTAYEGAAISTPNDHYNKQSFEDIISSPIQETADSGWVAMIQHYFVSAWIPSAHQTSTFYTQSYANNQYATGMLSSAQTLAHGQSGVFSASLYMGPAIAKQLNQAAPNLSLTIDYGWLWFISDPIFSVMQWVFHFVGNWGLAIILVTLLIKLIFYPLSTKNYRSMAKMRKLQPRIAHLKERFGEDKQKLSQATMELYRSEKVNPLGGCLPMIIQIPVFIALYWVIMESVEFRQAPFIFWIHDLSVKDPFYILPVLMGLSMFIQQKLNPAPPDPMQAKIMMFLPLVFTILFSQFPSGLVLYWLFNNCFSILQQWWIMRRVSKEPEHPAHHHKSVS